MAGLAPALVRAGVEVHLITPQPTGQLVSGDMLAEQPKWEVVEEGVVVHRVPLAEDISGVYDQAYKTNQSMQVQGYALVSDYGCLDIIHAHDWLVVFAAQALKHQFRVPLIATIHATERGRVREENLNTDLQRNIHGAEWWLAYEAWRLITCSHHMASEVQAFFHIPPEKIDVVPNGIGPYRNGRSTQVDVVDCRSRYTVSDCPVVFGVGRLVYEKGFHLLVEAIPHILSEFPDTQFVIAGRGPEAPNLRQQAVNLGVADHVHFPGFISNGERDCLYRTSDCAVFPSLYEPFGIVALEAMLAGCPVVVSEIGGLREVVCHGKTGVTVYPDDTQSVAWGILSVLRDPARAATRAREAQHLARCEFNWDMIAARTIAVYQRVLDERKRIVDW